MAIYYALVKDGFIQKDAENGLLEIYETAQAANMGRLNGLSIETVLVAKTWIDVSKKTPSNFEPVLISQKGNVLIGNIESNGWFSSNGLPIESPDAWMPMPDGYKT